MGKITYEVMKERERALRMESVVKRAVNVVKRYEKSYEDMKAERDDLKKQLAEKSKRNNVLSFSMKELRNKLRKAAHPDKHSDPKVKAAVNDIFVLIEEIFDESE